ncbi:NAD-dependent epimerase/dehydratase family protein [Lentzea sp. NBRC 102530]|uniref:NAD-dependent epimerase/dehydratase family protein n=1 Tax=Lentzea sp. NBRC 102530 TaxID=3032201 RepID=UPI0024A38244|nr:NAD-dependent epimerase/dehydratase family protein [Lentzea sp. NBRC 102530]GLY49799.1 reductase [Lentzea sp. NBRC 102530]
MSARGSVVVLGGTGFVGLHVCARLAETGFDVVAVARRPPDRALAGRFLAMDLTRVSAGELAGELAAIGPRVVVNATGSIWGRRNDEQMWDGAVVPTQRLLDALVLLGTRPRLIHLGSVLEYGPVRVGTSGTDTAERPGSAYGRAKLHATQAVLAEIRAGRFEGMVLRIANVAGPGSPAVSLLGRVAERLLAAGGTGPAEIELDPLQAHRDYVDVRDVAVAVTAAVTSTVSGELVPIGRGETVPVRTLVELLITHSRTPAVVVERPSTGARHSTEDWLRVDIGPAERLLGWRPQRTPAESVAAFWADFVRRAHDEPERSAVT